MRSYENLTKTSENRLPQRAYYIPGGRSQYNLLNGDWKFAYFKRDIDVPEKICEWDTIKVPSCWQILGYENPNYTNINYPYRAILRLCRMITRAAFMSASLMLRKNGDVFTLCLRAYQAVLMYM